MRLRSRGAHRTYPLPATRGPSVLPYDTLRSLPVGFPCVYSKRKLLLGKALAQCPTRGWFLTKTPYISRICLSNGRREQSSPWTLRLRRSARATYTPPTPTAARAFALRTLTL
jgi:hypothetical protein